MKLPEYPLDKKKEIFSWGPTPMKLFYTDCFESFFIDFPKVYKGFVWPKALIIFKEGRGVWMHEFPELRKDGGKLFLSYMLPIGKRGEARKNWKKSRDELIKEEKEMEKVDLTKISNEELIKIWRDFNNSINKFWVYSIIPELSNYGSSEILQDKLKSIVPQNEMMSVMEILTAPTEVSFYQEEEMDLAETDNLKGHQKKYFWLKNSYANVEVLPIEFFSERKKSISHKIREEVAQILNEAKIKKIKIRDKYKLNEEIMNIADAIDDAIIWQDTRKKDIWIYLHYKDLLLNEFTRRYKYDKKEALYLLSKEIIGLLEGKKIDFDIHERLHASGIFAMPGKIRVLDANAVLEYWERYVDAKTDNNISEFKGIVASKGDGKKIKGIVKIVLDPNRTTQFNEGDILVTTMTTPEYIFVMRRSSAIITDTGGLTSHAAIVSRELKKPCIVGTKVASHVLNNGDLVEVDATSGVVRIIK